MLRVPRVPRVPRVQWVTFYTRGIPHDNGLDLHLPEHIFRERVTPFVDGYAAYTPEIVRAQGGGHYVKEFGDEQHLPHNLGLHKIGMCMFKPWILLKEMERMEDGDILIYHDVNCLKYGVYL